MRGCLRKNKTVGGPITLDVTVDYPSGTDMAIGSNVKVRITEANGLLRGKAYVGLQYSWFEAEENVEVLGAEIVRPEKGIPGPLLVDTILTIRLIRTSSLA
jgi:hypothetical protein